MVSWTEAASVGGLYQSGSERAHKYKLSFLERFRFQIVVMAIPDRSTVRGHQSLTRIGSLSACERRSNSCCRKLNGC